MKKATIIVHNENGTNTTYYVDTDKLIVNKQYELQGFAPAKKTSTLELTGTIVRIKDENN